MSKYKVVSICFQLEKSVLPFALLEEIENFYKQRECVVYLEAHYGNKFICSFCDRDIANKILGEKEILLWKKKYPYKLEETDVTSIRIIPTADNVTPEELNQAIRTYGKICAFERDLLDPSTFIAVISLHRSLPSKISVNRNTCLILEVKD